MTTATILVGDVLQRLKDISDQSVQCVITSPPYWGLRDYGNDGQLGLEATPELYVENMVAVFREVWRVLKDDGVLWLNLGDTYRNKQLIGIPWKIAFALQTDGWYLRQDIIWHKSNPMPEPANDRFVRSHEYFFLLSKKSRYFFDNAVLREKAVTSHAFIGNNKNTFNKNRNDGNRRKIVGDGFRNRRSVWTIACGNFKGAHFAVMPKTLCDAPILATSRPDDLILDPFTGSGTVAVVALRHGRNFVGVELNPKYAAIAKERINNDQPSINKVQLNYGGNL